MGRHGENIHKRKDGRWEARYIQSYNGKKAIYRSVYGKSYREVKEKRDAALLQKKAAKMNSSFSVELFEDLADSWLEDRKGWIKESSYCHYHQILKTHILPNFGSRKVSELNAEDIQSFLYSLNNNGKSLSVKYISDIRSVLRMIFHYGNDLHITSFSNDRLMIPKKPPQKISVLTKAEQERLEKALKTCADQTLRVAVFLALYTGLRIGEICGLQWEDINRKEKTICISRTILRIRDLENKNGAHTKLVVQKPKSARSERIIPIPKYLCSELEKIRAAACCYVLTGREQFTEPRNLQRRFQSFTKSYDLQGYSFHSLRHTFATRCVESGMDVKSLSEIMGHASVTTTMQMYVHPSMDAKREQINKMELWMLQSDDS